MIADAIEGLINRNGFKVDARRLAGNHSLSEQIQKAR